MKTRHVVYHPIYCVVSRYLLFTFAMSVGVEISGIRKIRPMYLGERQEFRARWAWKLRRHACANALRGESSPDCYIKRICEKLRK